MPAPSAPSAENSPTAAAAMAKAPSVLAARSRSRELAGGAGANSVATNAARPTSPLGDPAAPGGAAHAGSSPLANLMDVSDVRCCKNHTGFSSMPSARRQSRLQCRCPSPCLIDSSYLDMRYLRAANRNCDSGSLLVTCFCCGAGAKDRVASAHGGRRLHGEPRGIWIHAGASPAASSLFDA